MFVIGLTLLTACQQINDIKGTVEGLTNPLVAEAIFLGVAQPDSNDIDLSGTEFDNGAALQVFLADASSVDEIEQAPVEGADLRVRVGGTSAVVLSEIGSGAYDATGDDGLNYTAESDAVVTAVIDGDQSQLSVTLPAAANADVPNNHGAGEALLVDLGDGSFNSVLAVVLNVRSGNVTWTNRPDGVKEVYDFTHTDEMVSTVAIPGEAFPANCACAVGIAGMVNADGTTFTNANTALSAFSAGKMKFYAVAVQ